jgi:hypothetical protein
MLTQAPSQKNHPAPLFPMECPKCHSHSVVQHGDSVYVCLSCDFRKDVSEFPRKDTLKEGDFNPLIAILLAVAIAILIL